MEPRSSTNFWRIFGVGTLALALLLVGGLIVFRQDILDWSRLRGYTPSAEIIELADETGLRDNARRLFYIQHPLLADKTAFNDYCRNDEHTIVLGCYVSNRGIFLLDVTDERLAGVEQVTAAHELLHAAYERLSTSERKKVDAMTAAAYEAITDQRVRQTVELYREQDASVVPNELHSILATEVRSLPEELENYYARYFRNRILVVQFSEQYEQAFIERRNQIREHDHQLASLKQKIDNLQSSLAQQSADLQSQRSQMSSLRSSGQIQAYNEQVAPYNRKVNNFNADVSELESLVAQYNEVVQKRNEVASEEAELVEAIDSRTVVPKQQ